MRSPSLQGEPYFAYKIDHQTLPGHVVKVSEVSSPEPTSTDAHKIQSGIYVSVSKREAIKACEALGEGYALINNNEWQTIARNIEGVDSNWSGGTAGNGDINRGHSAGDPARSLEAHSDETKPCYGIESDGTCGSSSTDKDKKRIHTLSNGEIIWDFSGNVWEFVEDTFRFIPGFEQYTSDAHVYEFPADKTHAHFVRTYINTFLAKNEFGPARVYTGNASQGHGLGYGFLYPANSHGFILRGGSYQFGTISEVADQNVAGIFTVNLKGTTTNQKIRSPYVGFRCVYRSNEVSIPRID